VKANVDGFVHSISTVRFDFPSALVALHPDINRGVGSERKDVADINIPEDPRTNLKHLMRCDQSYYWPEGLWR